MVWQSLRDAFSNEVVTLRQPQPLLLTADELGGTSWNLSLSMSPCHLDDPTAPMVGSQDGCVLTADEGGVASAAVCLELRGPASASGAPLVSSDGALGFPRGESAGRWVFSAKGDLQLELQSAAGFIVAGWRSVEGRMMAVTGDVPPGARLYLTGAVDRDGTIMRVRSGRMQLLVEKGRFNRVLRDVGTWQAARI